MKCPICNKELNPSGIGIHFKHIHKLNYKEYIKNQKGISKEITYYELSEEICAYGCGKIANFKLKNNKWCCSRHHSSCQANKLKNSKANKGKLYNPNSPFKIASNRYNWTNKSLSKSHKKNISEALKDHPAYKRDDIYVKSNEFRLKMRNIMLSKYQDGFEVRCGRAKKYIYTSPIAGEVKVDGTWEYKVCQYLDSIDVTWERNKKRFPYINIEGKESTYCPDFYVKDWDSYIEVKGYKVENDNYKWSQFKYELIIWNKEKLKELNIL